MRVLTWNLFHGRSVPETPRSLLPEFRAALSAWDWDVALLQEVPPWWPPILARAAAADHARTALTSRNHALWLRQAIAERRPDLIRSNGGGANAILLRRGAGVLTDHRRHTLTRRRPERRVAQAVALRGGAAGALTGDDDVPLWIGNLHASEADPLPRARADGARAAAWLAAVASGAPAVLGGDFNDRAPVHTGLRAVASRSVDHVLVPPGIDAAGKAHTLKRARRIDGATRRLSDHPPLVVVLRRV